MRSASIKVAAALAVIFTSKTAISQELGEVDLPKSGLSEQSLESRDELYEKFDLLNSQLKFWSGTHWAIFDVVGIKFKSYYLDKSDLSGCQYYLSGEILKSPKGWKGNLGENFAISITGATAEKRNDRTIQLSGYTVTWPNPTRSLLMSLMDIKSNYSEDDRKVFSALRAVRPKWGNASQSELGDYILSVGPDGLDAVVDDVKAQLISDGLKLPTVEFAFSSPMPFMFDDTGNLLMPVSPDINVETQISTLNELSETCSKLGW